MPNSFTVQFPAPSAVIHDIFALNTGTQDLALRVSGVSSVISLVPGEKIDYLVAPSGLGLSDSQASGLLEGDRQDDDSTGKYFISVNNTTNSDKDFDYPAFSLPKSWENTPFRLYWLQSIPGTTFKEFGRSSSYVFTLPHNLEPNEITISGHHSSDEKTVSYTVKYPVLKNENSSEYTGSSDLPYRINVKYTYPDTYPYTSNASGFETGWQYYSGGIMNSGIQFDLPFYDPREQWDNIPAVYTFLLNYNSAGTVQPGSMPAEIVLNHNFIQNNFTADLKARAAANPDINQLREAGTIDIPNDIISRRRLAIGIEDIKSIERVFEKEGIFVSNSYNLDFSIYTFSLKVDEFIPDYPGITKYDTVKYYVEFDNGEWIRISPISRENEMENNNLVPKLVVFDTPPEDISQAPIIYMNPVSLNNSFRIKIVLDLSKLQSATFVPPEVRNYRCLIFDKDHFSNIEG